MNEPEFRFNIAPLSSFKRDSKRDAMDCQSHKKAISPSNVDQLDNVSLEFCNGLRLGDEDGACLHDASHQCRCKDDKWVRHSIATTQKHLVKWLDSFLFYFFMCLVLWFAWGQLEGEEVLSSGKQLRATHSLQGPFDSVTQQIPNHNLMDHFTVINASSFFFFLGYPIRVWVPDWTVHLNSSELGSHV